MPESRYYFCIDDPDVIKSQYIKTSTNLDCYHIFFLQILFDDSPSTQLHNHIPQGHFCILAHSRFSPSFTNSIDFIASV